MENTYFLLGFWSCSYGVLVLQKRAELARCTCLLPFSPMTQQKNEERNQNLLLIFFLLSVTELAWSVLQCV